MSAHGSLAVAYRTHSCGELRLEAAETTVRLGGWVHRRRDHGGLVFIDLRDRYGHTQMVCDPSVCGPETFATIERLHAEDVVIATGTVIARPQDARSKKLATGDIEVHVTALEVLNRAEQLAIDVGAPEAEGDNVAAEIRMRHRHVDLRRPAMQERLMFRHKVVLALRNAFNDLDFIDVETPILTRSTPEGARDYLVPSRVHAGTFYALPQSPQLFKQLLMVSGYDRYFQVARCFRDEDLRADRQPEFTQLDMEMSFVDENDIYTTFEHVFTQLWKEVLDKDLVTPFPRLTYDEVLLRYGSDKPDLRNPLTICDITELASRSPLSFLRDAACAEASAKQAGGAVRALRVPGAAASFSRKQLDGLAAEVAPSGAQAVGWLKVGPDSTLQGALKKGFADELAEPFCNQTQARDGDLVLVIADGNADVTAAGCGALRTHVAEVLDLVDASTDAFLWVTEFPYFEHDAATDTYIACRHPFTQPLVQDIEALEKRPLGVRTRAYDLVLNGWEMGSGSIRNHEPALQRRVLNVLGYSEEEIVHRFGFLLEALDAGAPPHGGAAIGIDRLCAIMQGLRNLREVIAFPKTAKAACLLTKAPSVVADDQLHALSITLTKGQPSTS